MSAVTVAIAALFVWRQMRAPAPAAEWQLYRTPSFAAATAYTLLTNLTMYTTLLMIPFFVREVQDKGTELSGLLLGGMSVLMAVTAPFGGRLSDAWGRRPSAQLGSALMLVASIALLAGLSESVSPVYLGGCLALMGLGLGLGVGAASTAAVESAPRSLAGGASGTSSMMRYVGSIVGAGILAGVLTTDNAGGDVAMFRLVSLAVTVTAAMALVSSVFIHRFVANEHTPVLREPAPEAV
jgi:DHA2 family multidrug resistance protein-like MFS transporter